MEKRALLIIRFPKRKGQRMSQTQSKQSVVAPVEGWWDLISGHEGTFTEMQTLYHSLSDTKAKIKSLFLSSDHRLCIEVERDGKGAFFEVEVFLKNGNLNRLNYIKEIIRLAKRKNKTFGGVLSGVWLHHLREEEKLEKLVKG